MPRRWPIAIVFLAAGYSCLLALQEFAIRWPSALAWDEPRSELLRRAAVARSRGLEFDERAPSEVAASLGGNAIPLVVPSYFLDRPLPDGLFPLSAPALRTTVFCNESGRYVVYPSDERGFRNPLGKQGNATVALIGDSLVHGACVEKDLGALLRDRGVRALNLGMARSGPLYNLAVLSEFSRPAKRVLWFHSSRNDLEEGQHERRNPRLMAYLDSGFVAGDARRKEVDHAVLSRASADLAAMARQREVGRDRPASGSRLTLAPLRRFLRLWAQGSPPRELSAASLALWEKAIGSANARVRGWGGKLSVVYLPHWEDIAEPQSTARERDAVATLCRQHNIEFLDLSTMVSQPDPWRYFALGMPGHYNESGYAAVAGRVVDLLAQKGE